MYLFTIKSAWKVYFIDFVQYIDIIGSLWSADSNSEQLENIASLTQQRLFISLIDFVDHNVVIHNNNGKTNN